jgi:hypothetical protein
MPRRIFPLPTDIAQAALELPAQTAPWNMLLKGALWHTLPRMAAYVTHRKFGHWMLDRTHGKRA